MLVVDLRVQIIDRDDPVEPIEQTLSYRASDKTSPTGDNARIAR